MLKHDNNGCYLSASPNHIFVHSEKTLNIISISAHGCLVAFDFNEALHRVVRNTVIQLIRYVIALNRTALLYSSRV